MRLKLYIYQVFEMSSVLLRVFVYRCYSGAKQEEAHYLENRTLR